MVQSHSVLYLLPKSLPGAARQYQPVAELAQRARPVLLISKAFDLPSSDGTGSSEAASRPNFFLILAGFVVGSEGLKLGAASVPS
jgi:hypothetical protein